MYIIQVADDHSLECGNALPHMVHRNEKQPWNHIIGFTWKDIVPVTRTKQRQVYKILHRRFSCPEIRAANYASKTELPVPGLAFA